MNQKIPMIACLLAFAGAVSAAEPPRQTFECDTPAGHFSYWNRTVSAAKIDITGTLTVNELRKGDKWNPTALVSLDGADEKTGFGVRVYVLPKVDKDTFFLEVLKPGGSDKLGLGVMPATGKPLPFAIHFDAGQVKVSLGGFDAAVPAGDFKPASIQLSCSTGDFEFKDFVIQE